MRITVIHNTLNTFKLIERAQHRLSRATGYVTEVELRMLS